MKEIDFTDQNLCLRVMDYGGGPFYESVNEKLIRLSSDLKNIIEEGLKTPKERNCPTGGPGLTANNTIDVWSPAQLEAMGFSKKDALHDLVHGFETKVPLLGLLVSAPHTLSGRPPYASIDESIPLESRQIKAIIMRRLFVMMARSWIDSAAGAGLFEAINTTKTPCLNEDLGLIDFEAAVSRS